LCFNAPALDGDTVVFRAEGSTGARGIYSESAGTLDVVVDTSDAMPGGTGNFVDFGPLPSADGGSVAFRGYGCCSQRGLFTSDGGSVTMVADTHTTLPSGTGRFAFFGEPSIGDGVAFGGTGSFGQAGVYADLGAGLTMLYNTATVVPGGAGGRFLALANPDLQGGSVAFFGSGGGQSGIYGDVDGTLVAIVDRSTPIPDGAGTFSSFEGLPVIDGAEVVFKAAGPYGAGVYRGDGNTITTIADLSTSIPDGPGSFTGFTHPAAMDGSVAFVGLGAGGHVGIYLFADDALTKLVDTSDMLDDKEVADLDITRDGLASGGQIAFLADFTNGSQAVYVSGSSEEPQTLFPVADSFIAGRGGHNHEWCDADEHPGKGHHCQAAKNRNEGANPVLAVWHRYRSVLEFDLSGVDTSQVGRATLVLTIAGEASGFKCHGDDKHRTVDAHPLLRSFTEGNGKVIGVAKADRFVGDGAGVTWHCATDADISNTHKDCEVADRWDGGEFGPATASPVVHESGLVGTVEWDVTADVQAGASGWLIKRTEENWHGVVAYFSKEGAAEEGDLDLAPRLIIEPAGAEEPDEGDPDPGAGEGEGCSIDPLSGPGADDVAQLALFLALGLVRRRRRRPG
jgi:hypothetical protein